MRRSDREVRDPARIEQIVRSCDRMRLGFNDGGEVYIVPLSFGYEKRDDSYTFYFHSAAQGRKVDLIRSEPRVGFEMDSGYRVCGEDEACEYSAAFASVIGNGRISIVTDREEKIRGLRSVMEKNTGRKDWDFPEDSLARVCVFRLDADSMSAKEHE